AWVAERVASAWEGGDLARVRVEACESLAQIGVPRVGADGLLRRIPEVLADTANGFQRTLGEQVDLDRLATDPHAQLVELNNGYEQLVRRLEALLKEKDTLALELQQANEELATLAATDPLTALPNKRSLMSALARDLALADRNRTSLALVILDVDFF